ncbi:hypothetical protein GOZ90_20035 [Agrobacterium vitis]|uniref:Uncharacterized protein n=1 Tax=Agrobacterium vitis TaxID=373 RepID=A0A6L6VNH9_AGRVI|nr:hypothetical protein [Agrobacterium vitis]MUZ74982.1 hypothetical protein [Agrobacterium vitis]
MNYARLLHRLGSTWPQEQLFELGISLYTLVNANWSYWRLTGTDDQIAIERQIVLTITLIAPTLTGSERPLASRWKIALTRRRNGTPCRDQSQVEITRLHNSLNRIENADVNLCRQPLHRHNAISAAVRAGMTSWQWLRSAEAFAWW